MNTPRAATRVVATHNFSFGSYDIELYVKKNDKIPVIFFGASREKCAMFRRPKSVPTVRKIPWKCD